MDDLGRLSPIEIEWWHYLAMYLMVCGGMLLATYDDKHLGALKFGFLFRLYFAFIVWISVLVAGMIGISSFKLLFTEDYNLVQIAKLVVVNIIVWLPSVPYWYKLYQGREILQVVEEEPHEALVEVE